MSAPPPVRHVLFVQGGGEGTHDDWDNRLVASLRDGLGAGYEVAYPRMPNEADPQYGAWKAKIEAELARLGEGVIVVGHSVGGTILVNALAERGSDAAVGGIFLVAAPYVGSSGWPSEEIEIRPDLGARLPRGAPVVLYRGDKDDTVPAAHLDLYARAIPAAKIRRLDGRDHQLNDDLSEVAEDILGLAPSD